MTLEKALEEIIHSDPKEWNQFELTEEVRKKGFQNPSEEIVTVLNSGKVIGVRPSKHGTTDLKGRKHWRWIGPPGYQNQPPKD